MMAYISSSDGILFIIAVNDVIKSLNVFNNDLFYLKKKELLEQK